MFYVKSKDWPGKGSPWIVCAAILYKAEIGDIVVVGPRHHDPTMRAQIEAYSSMHPCEKSNSVQGFIDQFGDFYTREEAWKIAEKNGQIRKRCGGDTVNGGQLFSENLY